MILIAESPSRRTEYRRYLGNAGLVAFSEELIFRGVLPAALSTFISNRVIVAIIASIVFAAVHWSKGVGSIITAFFYGIVFMIAYYRANSIVSPAIAHYMVNLVIYL